MHVHNTCTLYALYYCCILLLCDTFPFSLSLRQFLPSPINIHTRIDYPLSLSLSPWLTHSAALDALFGDIQHPLLSLLFPPASLHTHTERESKSCNIRRCCCVVLRMQKRRYLPFVRRRKRPLGGGGGLHMRCREEKPPLWMCKQKGGSVVQMHFSRLSALASSILSVSSSFKTTLLISLSQGGGPFLARSFTTYSEGHSVISE